MRYSLAEMVGRGKSRKRTYLFRPIHPAPMLATDLYLKAYEPVYRLWREAIPRIVEVYQRSLAGMAQDSAADVSEVLRVTNSEFNFLLLSIKARLEEWAARLERWQAGKWIAATKAATGVDPSMMVGPRDVRVTLETRIEANVALVTSVSDETRRKIADTVFQGYKSRENPRKMAKALVAITELSRKRARRIAADQNVKLAAELNRERRRQAGLDKWEWVHSGKLHPREEHKARHGKRYSDQTAPKDLPGDLPYCGCTELAVLDLDDD